MIALGDVPSSPDVVSKFGIPYGNVYLAHNDLAGQYFDELAPGQFIRFHDGNEWIDYEITEVIEAQASDPYSNKTALLLDGAWRNPEWVHRNIFTGTDRLVLQTCVERGGVWTWGRLFVIAERVTPDRKPGTPALAGVPVNQPGKGHITGGWR